MNDEWRTKSVKIFLILLLVTTLLFTLSSIFATNLTIDQITKNNNITVGETVMQGTSIEHCDVQVRYPLISNPHFLVHELTSLDLFGILQSISTGSVSYDYSYVVSNGLSADGVSNVKGPGFLDVENGKFIIHECNYTLSGYTYPDNYLVKNKTGISVYESGKYSHTVPIDEVKKQEWSGPNFNITTIQNWYNSNSNAYGSIFVTDLGVGNINDGRNNLSSSEIINIFGQDTYDYILQYPYGDGVCIYIPDNYKATTGPKYSTTLGDYSEYGNSLRDFNANQFCKAWNNTVLPPGTTVCGKEHISFQVADDSESPSGSAAHGVCPSARTLRACCLDEGYSLPVGMSNDENAVLYGYNPSTGIFITNTGDYPVRIIMWTEGSGVSMTIHCQFIRYIPPGYSFTHSNSTTTSSST